MTGAGRNKAFISKSADNDIVAVCLSCAGAACREANCLVITGSTHCPKIKMDVENLKYKFWELLVG